MAPYLLLFIFCLSPLFGQGTVDLPESLAAPDAEVEPVKVGLAYSEGPAVDSMGNIYFSENPESMTGRIWKITPDGKDSVYFDPSNGSNGLEFDPQGRLVSCQKDMLVSFGPDGEPDYSITSQTTGFELGKINDLSFGSDGSVYFTNLNEGDVFYRSPEGEITEITTFNRPNGIEWIEEDGIIYVAANGLQKCKVESNRDITDCEEFTSHHVDGLTLDEMGNLYTADWEMGILKVHSPDGTQIGSVSIEAQNSPGGMRPGTMGNTSNCIFGGPERKTLYITGNGGLYKVEMNVKGRAPHWWPPYMKEANPDTASSAIFQKNIKDRAQSRFLPSEASGPANGYRNILGRSTHRTQRSAPGWFFFKH